MEVVGFENYLIYEDGKVYSKKTKRYLKAGDNGKGYLQVVLCKDGKPKKFLVHRLVGLHHIPNKEGKKELDHINRDKTDNSVENLRWVTRSENNLNLGVRRDNKLGIKNISYDKLRDIYVYKKQIRGKIHHKFFKTLEDAIQYKINYEKNM